MTLVERVGVPGLNPTQVHLRNYPLDTYQRAGYKLNLEQAQEGLRELTQLDSHLREIQGKAQYSQKLREILGKVTPRPT